MVEKLIKEGQLWRYVRKPDHELELGQASDRITVSVTTPIESRPAINYILGGPSDDQYQSKHQRKKLLRDATVKARVKAIHMEGGHEETKPIDGPISFPLVNPNRIIVLHYDALVLTLCINGFDVHMVLVDPSSATNLLQLLTFERMKLSLGMLNSARRILFSTANAEAISKDLDMTDELWEVAAIRIVSYQQRMENLYNRKIKPHAFRTRDLVLRKVFENTADPVTGKFQPN